MNQKKIPPAHIELDRDTGQAGYIRIVTHLTAMDKDFIPILSDRVDIQSYSKKIHEHAIRIYARQDENDIGHCYFYLNKMGHAYITSFGVRGQNRKCRIGTEIMEKVKEICRDSFVNEIGLKVSIENAAALSFYEKNGFLNENLQPPWLFMKYLF